MESNSKTARPYAVAAFNQAREEDRTGDWSVFLENLATIVQDPTVAGLIASPAFSGEKLTALVSDLAGDSVTETQRNFLTILVENERLNALPDMARLYELERSRLESRSQVQVTSAFALDESQIRVIADAMAKRLGTEIDINVTVDESLIGGVVIRTGDLVIDGSLRGRLSQLSQILA